MANKHSPFYREEELKNFDFSPWGGLQGFLDATSNGAATNNRGMALKRIVPDLSRAVDMVSVGIARMPFEIVDEGGEVFDASYEWENKLGGMEKPQRLIYLLASALCGGAAYIKPRATPKAIIDLQYLVPHSIQPFINRDGLQYFDRVTDQGMTERLEIDDILYFWLPDSDVEIGPAMNTPLSNALADAQLILNATQTMAMYGERGFVPITVLGAKNIPGEAERQKAESFWDRLLKGGFRERAKIINSEALSVVPVGAGMDQLRGSYVELKRESKESIAAAFGIPSAMFMSDNAFASEFKELHIQFYTASRLVSIYQTIEEIMTEQLLKPLFGKQMFFRPETMDIFQEDMGEQTASMKLIVDAVNINPAAARFGMDVMGIELTTEQEGLLLEAETAAEEKREQDMEMQQAALDAKQPPANAKKPAPKPKKSLTPDELKDLTLWYSKAKAWHLKGKGNAVDWENKHLSEEIAAPIRVKLAQAQNELDIVKAFELEDAPMMDEAAMILEGIRLALQ